MKILLINGSPRKNGNTGILLREALSGASECGADAELLSIVDMNIEPCNSCFACTDTSECAIEDDMQKVYSKLIEADGIIFGTPVYFWGMTAQLKTVIDRMFALCASELKLRNKTGGLVAVSARRGSMNVANIFNMFFLYNHMIPTDPIFGFAGFKEGEILKDEIAMKGSRELGRLMVKLISNGSKIVYPPECENKTTLNYVLGKYNLSF